MYQTGKILDSLAPRGTIRGVMGLVTAPLKYGKQEENRKISEYKRLRRKIENDRKRAETVKWFKGLSKEDQVKVIAKQEKVKQARLKQQTERARIAGAIIGNILKDGLSSMSRGSGYSGVDGYTAENRLKNRTMNSSGRMVDN